MINKGTPINQHRTPKAIAPNLEIGDTIIIGNGLYEMRGISNINTKPEITFQLRELFSEPSDGYT